jgi:uncharacterized membrane protein YbhN (UPF0104 family)
MLRRGLHIGIAVVLLLGVALTVLATLEELPNVDWRFRPGWFGLGVAAIALALFLNAELWRRTLQALGPRLAPLPAASIWFTSGLGRFVPTSLLMPIVRIAMAGREGVPQRICLASVVYEVALGVSAGLVFGAYFVVNLPELQDESGRFLVLVLPVAALTVLHPQIFHTAADLALERLGRERLPLALGMGMVVKLISLYVVSYLLAGAGVFSLAQIVHPLGAGDLIIVSGAFAAATALGLLAFVLPAGLGAREAALAVALSPIMPGPAAVTVAILARLVQIGLELGLALGTQLVYTRAPRV